MNQKRLLIAGIDPGTTTGYAFLNDKGVIIHSGSSKEVELKSLLKKAVSLGKVVAVGTDKAKTPRLVQEFAAKLGAKIVHPEEDLKVVEKKTMVPIKAKDLHESDAIASSIFAHNNVSSLIRKVRKYCEEENKKEMEVQIMEVVIKKGVNVSEAARSLEQPIRKKQLKPTKKEEVVSKTVHKLRTTIKQLETEMSILKRQNSFLKKRKVEKALIVRAVRPSTVVEQKNKEIILLRKKLSQKDRESKKRGKRISILEGFLQKKKGHYLLKKLRNLGKEEFKKKKNLLQIKEGDILLVNDPGTTSLSVVDQLKGVHILIHKKRVSEKMSKQLPFLLIPFSKLKIEEDIHFALTKKKEFDDFIQSKVSLKKIVEEYQKERLMEADHI